MFYPGLIFNYGSFPYGVLKSFPKSQEKNFRLLHLSVSSSSFYDKQRDVSSKNAI